MNLQLWNGAYCLKTWSMIDLLTPVIVLSNFYCHHHHLTVTSSSGWDMFTRFAMFLRSICFPVPSPAKQHGTSRGSDIVFEGLFRPGLTHTLFGTVVHRHATQVPPLLGMLTAPHTMNTDRFTWDVSGLRMRKWEIGINKEKGHYRQSTNLLANGSKQLPVYS